MNFHFLKNDKLNASLLNIVGTCIYTWFMFRTILMNLSTSLITTGGDGIKNYYTYLYHCLYGKGTVFTGMNYPFNEHVIYTDNQPLLAVPLSYLRDIFKLELGDFLVIMNIMFPLIFIFSSFILFKLLSKLTINLYLSAAFGLIFTAMSPNLFKTFWHFGMSYSIFITGSIYFVLSYLKEQKINYLLSLFILNLLVTYLHVYDFAISSITILTLSIGYLIFDKEKFKLKIKTIFPLIGIIGLSFFIFKVILFFTDSVKDRPKNPWGILEYITKVPNIFTSSISNLGNSFLLLFHENAASDINEGYVYIGFIPSLFCFFLLINWLLRIFKKHIKIEPIELLPVQKILIFSGVLCLLFSMGIPFIWNMEYLLDYLSFLKQFRALGRFSWPFYFCISIATLISIDLFLKSYLIQHKKYLVLTTTLIILFISAIEMFCYGGFVQSRGDTSVKNYNEFFSEIVTLKEFNKSVHIDTQYQGMIVMPYFLEGSDKVGAQSYGHIVDFSFQYSLATKLPMMNTLLARSSWSQSFALMRFIGGEFSNKDLIKSKLNNKPILIITETNANLTAGEKYLVNNSSLIGHYKNWNFFNLSTINLFKKEAIDKDSILRNFKEPNPSIFHKSFENESSKVSLFGNNSLDITTIDSVRIYDDTLNFKNGTELEFSLWTLVNKVDFRMPGIYLYLLNSQKKVVKKEYLWAFHSTDNTNFWFRMDYHFTKSDSTQYLKIDFFNFEKRCATNIDEIEIRDTKLNSQYKLNEKVLFNNHLIN